MRSQFRKTLLGAVAIAAAVISSVVGALSVGAAVPQSLELPVSQVFDTNSSSISSTFTYQFSGVGAAPMPVGSPDGSYTFTMDGTSNITLPRIVFNTVGVYEYKLSGVKADVANYVYDSQVYTIDVYVTNETSKPTVLVYLDDGTSAGDKAPVISFTQTYNGPTPSPIPTPSPKPPSGASAQTGGVLAQAEWAWLLAACLLAAAAVPVIVVVFKRRKAEEAEIAREDANLGVRHS